MMSTRHSVDARPFSHPARAEIRRGNIRECNLKRRNATLEAGNRSHSGELMKREDKKLCKIRIMLSYRNIKIAFTSEDSAPMTPFQYTRTYEAYCNDGERKVRCSIMCLSRKPRFS